MRYTTSVRFIPEITIITAQKFKFSLKKMIDFVLREEENDLDVHAGAFETCWMLHSYRELVNEEIARKQEPTELGVKELIAWSQGGSTAKSLTPKGYLGNPANMDVKKIEEIEAIIIDSYAKALMELL